MKSNMYKVVYLLSLHVSAHMGHLQKAYVKRKLL
jgi:hypothetical protein